jgi:diaminohydroxyphosphoribosylaminopyrimidine deaminase / 5-amino-6-(5-phosphoribosylamino)uracil reductase
VLVEGGAGVHGAFLDARAADELHVFVAPVLVGGTGATGVTGGRGVERLSDALRPGELTAEACGADVYLHGRAPALSS